MSSTSQHIVQTLWRYCNILRDDGLSYPDYVEQLTYLLFLKMAQEQQHSNGGSSVIPSDWNWNSLIETQDNAELHEHYTRMLEALSDGPGTLGVIFKGATNKITDPAKLSLLVNDLIGRQTWSSLDADVKGDAYEGLLEKNAQDTKSGAGQYFTPRPVIHAVMEVIGPRPDDTICDPACGTAGFLLAGIQSMRRHREKLTTSQRERIRLHAVRGVELVPAVARLAAMNLFLHGVGPVGDEAPPPIMVTDSLRADPGDRYSIVVTNPPFGRKSSVTVLTDADDRRIQELTVKRSDFCATTSNKQLNFLQHVVTILAPSGRAAVVVPDNVLFEGGAGAQVRRRLIDECNVHTLLRLPPGIFYAGGVKANVLFFDKPKAGDSIRTERLWVFDLRSNFRFSLRSNPIVRADLDEFVHCYKAQDVENRRATWSQKKPAGRWRAFQYKELVARKDMNLDISWIPVGTQLDSSNLDPSELAAGIVKDLRLALSELESISAEIPPKGA